MMLSPFALRIRKLLSFSIKLVEAMSIENGEEDDPIFHGIHLVLSRKKVVSVLAHRVFSGDCVEKLFCTLCERTFAVLA